MFLSPLELSGDKGTIITNSTQGKCENNMVACNLAALLTNMLSKSFSGVARMEWEHPPN
jgi:hypothetical protein